MSAEIPCMLDPALNCPQNCGLRDRAEKITRALAERSGHSLEKETTLLRGKDHEDLRRGLRHQTSDMLRKAKLNEDCANYPHADILFEKSQ